MQNTKTVSQNNITHLESKTTLQKNLLYVKKNYELYLLIFPVVLFIIIFNYVPMYGIQIAFRDFMPGFGIWDSPWIGLDNFTTFFNGPYFFTVLKNTITLSLVSLVAGVPAPIILALFLNSLPSERYKRIIQTITYAPNFISTVVIVGMMKLFLSPSVGFVNKLIEAFGGDAVNFFAEPSAFVPMYVISGIWQGCGWGSIIYLAALSSISTELYEAAIVDGATKMQRIWHIDIPGILPTIAIMLILSCGSILSIGFEKVYLMQNDLNSGVSEVISTYVYKVGMLRSQFSFSTAIGLFNSVVNLILLIIVNKITKKLTETSLW